MNYSVANSVGKNRVNLLQCINVVFLLITIGINAAAILLPINGQSTSQISDNNPNLIVPAGFTFSIWSVIYTYLLISQILIMIRDIKQNWIYTDATKNIGLAFIASCICNCVWLLSWHYNELLLSVMIMITFLLTLIYIYVKLNIGKDSDYPRFEITGIYSIYLAWISVATITNIATALVYYSWSGLGVSAFSWTVIMFTLIFLLSLYMLFYRYDVLFTLVICWALYGISKKTNATLPDLHHVTEISFILMIALLLTVIVKKSRSIFLNYKN